MGDSLLWPAMRRLANVIRSLSIADIMANDCLRGHAELVQKLRGSLSPGMRYLLNGVPSATGAGSWL